MQKGTTISGHHLSVIFENNDKSKPIFIDGQNGFTEASFEAYASKWKQYGWELTAVEASRFVSDDTGSHWDSITFV